MYAVNLRAHLFNDRISGEDNAIGRVRLCVRLFPPHFSKRLAFDLEFHMYVGHDHS